MKFEDSKYFKMLKHFKLKKPFGNFYFLDNFVVSEIHEGVHFDSEMINSVAQEILKHYERTPVDPASFIYITNKINSYSLDPNFWKITEAKYGSKHTRAIVAYNSWGHNNASIEKMFSKAEIKFFNTLNEAIEWALSLN